MNQTEAQLFKKLNELLNTKLKISTNNELIIIKKHPTKSSAYSTTPLKQKSSLNVKILIIMNELQKRGYNTNSIIQSNYSPITGQIITINSVEDIKNNECFDDEPFEDDGAYAEDDKD